MPFNAGSRLLAKLTRLELERGIFIAGHRFEPYRGPEIAPWDIELATAGGGALASRTVPLALRDAAIFFG